MERRRRIRVLLAGIPHTILNDILAEVAGARGDIEVVGRCAADDLTRELNEREADVVVLGGDSPGLEESCRQLLSSFPDLAVIVALALDGGITAFHVGDISPSALVRTIRSAAGAPLEPRAIQVDGPETGYASSEEHLEDEIDLLDLRLRAAFAREGLDRAQTSAPGWGPSPSAVLDALGIPGDDSAPEVAFERVSERIRRRLSATSTDSIAVGRIGHTFGLDRFEVECMLLCYAAEVDRRYGDAYALLQQDVTRRRPGVGLVLELLCDTPEQRRSARRSLRVDGALFQARILRADASDGDLRLDTPLEIDAGILRVLLGHDGIDPRLEGIAWASTGPAPDEDVPVQRDLCERLAGAVLRARSDVAESIGPQHLVVHVHGPTGSGRRALVEQVCAIQALRLVRCDLSIALASARPFDELVELVAREAQLGSAAVAFERFDLLLARDDLALRQLVVALERYPSVAFLIGEREWVPRSSLVEAAFLPVRMPELDSEDSDQLWQRELDRRGVTVAAEEMQVLSDRYRLTPAQIRDAVRAAEDSARLDPRALDASSLHAAARLQATPDLARFATRIVPRITSADIVLPPEDQRQLDEIVAQARSERRVFSDWNFGSKLSHGRALTALFTGVSGTGKTMAAEIVAGELHMELWKLNLAKVMSRYVGVLEENLEQVFCQAESAPVCLMLDEADSLLSKRSEVRDARDRYANVEVAYLLQRIDEFRGRGVVIFATNLMKNLDEALVRRMRFIVPFRMPGAAQRRELWRRSFPADTPLHSGIELELDDLAERVPLSGGSIKNICLRAAFTAAAEGAHEVGRRHLSDAVDRELEKMGRPVRPEERTSRRERAQALYGEDVA